MSSDCSCGVYRSRDPISNFQIRVRLERRATSSMIPLPGRTLQSGGIELEELGRGSNKMPGLECEERIIGWQEKIFSQQEVDRYAIESNCHSVQEMKYHQTIKNKRHDEANIKWISTFIEGDDDVPQQKHLGVDVDPSYLERNVSSVRQRKASLKTSLQSDRNFSSKVNVVNNRPSRTLQRLWHCATAQRQTMVVVANLARNKLREEVAPVTLCTIQMDEHGVVYVEPDFSDEPYDLGSNDFGKETYSYMVEHASQQIGTLEQEEETNLNRRLYSQRTESLAKLVGHEFDQVPADTFRLNAFGEIVSAERFEYDNLYVNFLMDMPQNWTLMSEEAGARFVAAATQTCATKRLHGRDVAYFCHPFEFHMSCNASSLFASKWPRLLLQVVSNDAWNRFRTEGYGFVDIPRIPGCYVFQVPTWRPRALSTVTSLRRFFVGGSPELDDYSAAASTHQGNVLSKFGMQTETSGTVTLRLHTVVQSLERHADDIAPGATTVPTTKSFSALQTSVAAVLEAFQRARQRMLAARGNLNL